MKNNIGLSKLAYLGPEGTYTHQAALNRFGTAVVYLQKNSISDVFNAVSLEAEYGLIPKENSIFGSVNEAYDLLRGEDAATSHFIREEFAFEIKHCLLVRRGVKLEDVTRVVSHEQALGQCSDFLSKTLGQAVLVKSNSTASAAKSLLDDTTISRTSAAICSKVCESLFSELEVLCEDIQNVNTNFTKFWLLSHPLETGPHGGSTVSPMVERHVLLRVQPPPHAPLRFEVSSIFRALDATVLRIDRRPSLNQLPFHDVYFVEVLQSIVTEPSETPSTRLCAHHALQVWNGGIDDAMDRVRQLGCEIKLMGLWY